MDDIIHTSLPHNFRSSFLVFISISVCLHLSLSFSSLYLAGQSGHAELTSIILSYGEKQAPGLENNPNNCTSYKIMNRDVAKCIAVVRSNNIGSGALNILRFDNDIDENNFRISTFESQFGPNSKYYKKVKKLHEYLFTGNENNFAVRNHLFANQTLRPVGFFRKIPKGEEHSLIFYAECFLFFFSIFFSAYFILFLCMIICVCVYVCVYVCVCESMTNHLSLHFSYLLPSTHCY